MAFANHLKNKNEFWKMSYDFGPNYNLRISFLSTRRTLNGSAGDGLPHSPDKIRHLQN